MKDTVFIFTGFCLLVLAVSLLEVISSLTLLKDCTKQTRQPGTIKGFLGTTISTPTSFADHVILLQSSQVFS